MYAHIDYKYVRTTNQQSFTFPTICFLSFWLDLYYWSFLLCEL